VLMLVFITSSSTLAIVESQNVEYLGEYTYNGGDGQGQGGYGSISGCTYRRGKDWSVHVLPFVQVQGGGKADTSDVFGHYSLDNLPLDQSYQVTASKGGYETKTATVNLSSSSPMYTLNFILDPDGDGSGSYLECSIANVHIKQADVT